MDIGHTTGKIEKIGVTGKVFQIRGSWTGGWRRVYFDDECITNAVFWRVAAVNPAKVPTVAEASQLLQCEN